MLTVIRRYTFRLYPNKSQTSKLFEARRLHCYLYNAAISHRKTEYQYWSKSVTYLQQQNALPAFKECWPEYKKLNSQTLQATLKRVDLSYNRFIKSLSQKPLFKSIRNYSGWTYPGHSGWNALTEGKHGQVRLRDLGITIRMRGQAKQWGTPTTLTIIYKPYLNQWFASFTVNIEVPNRKFGSDSDLKYESMLSIDLGTETVLTAYNGQEFLEIENQRFTLRSQKKIKSASKKLRRKRCPNYQKKIKASKRWKKARKQVSKLQRKVAEQRKNWQHHVTTDISRRYDIVVTEKLETKKMTRKAKPGSQRKRQKAGLNKSILDVGFGTLNKMITYKIEAKGGLVLFLPTRKIKPSQRCPNCGTVHKDWANLSNRYHVCNHCHFENGRDKSSVMVMYNVATYQQPGLGTHLEIVDLISSTSKNRKHTGSMKQLGEMKRQKSQQNQKSLGHLETPTSQKLG
ncbi:MAG: transposase [Crocosphaera sp.]|nr:transposase [Crocosphaera sp.]